jgi:hypothetical protein
MGKLVLRNIMKKIFFVLIIAGLFVGCGYKKTPIYQSSLDTTQVNI